MKKRLLLPVAGFLFSSPSSAQMDYTNLYEHYKTFDQEKLITVYAAGSHIYGSYNHLDILMLASNLPLMDPMAQSIGGGGRIEQDRLLMGVDAVFFSNLFGAEHYKQTGAFQYVYGGYEFYCGKNDQASLLTGFGLGLLTAQQRLPANPSNPRPESAPVYSFYNMRPLGAGILLFNFALAYNHYFDDAFSLGIKAGMDCIPGAAWNNGDYRSCTWGRPSEFATKAYVSITTGYCFEN
ncbi:MAG TPA: hypothetical protein VGO45_09745 [Bacteroidia bacterium]|jgi:hypothetical protein|nr:hypothetical protein [Bacteroidia bacterium]